MKGELLSNQSILSEAPINTVTLSNKLTVKWVWAVFFSVIAPEVLCFIRSFHRTLFRNVKRPTFLQFIVVSEYLAPLQSSITEISRNWKDYILCFRFCSWKVCMLLESAFWCSRFFQILIRSQVTDTERLYGKQLPSLGSSQNSSFLFSRNVDQCNMSCARSDDTHVQESIQG